MRKRLIHKIILPALACLIIPFIIPAKDVNAIETVTGGGYAASGQLKDAGYACKVYDATNGLPTSDGNFIMSASDGYIWIGGYSGIIRYDGSTFERLDPTDGLTSGRVIFEDKKNRVWVGTNDNGIVVMDGDVRAARYTYEDGLPSSSIRTFAEDQSGVIYIGSTAGVSYVDESGNLGNIDDDRLADKIVVRLTADTNGKIYGNTKDGDIFTVEDKKVSGFYSHADIGCEVISTVFADPEDPGKVYLGTETDTVYYGMFGDDSSKLTKIDVSPAENIYWITYACGRVWITSESIAGYIDDGQSFHVLSNIPMNNSIDMMTSDYQGNLWFASSRQGIMKVVTNNFRDITRAAGIEPLAVNTTCLSDDLLYVGTDNGLFIIDRDLKTVDDRITEYLKNTRIRCIMKDSAGNMWFSTYTRDLGLVCLDTSGKITSYTEEDKMPSNKVRCTVMAKDGSVLAGTNGGLAVIKDGRIVRTVGASDIVTNTVFLTVCEGEDGTVYEGSDGDGIYVMEGDDIRKLGREDGLTSDVILRIKRDEKRGVYWIITSNSVEYMKDGTITCIRSFPYNNNYDIFPDNNGNMWILSSMGVYCVSADEMLGDDVRDIKLYDYSNGLPAAPTSNSFSAIDDDGMLYISDRSGVCSVNVNRFYEEQQHDIMIGLKSVSCNNEIIEPDENGQYTIPAVMGRIQITPAILDYSMTNPLIHVFLDGTEDTGMTAAQSDLTPLEYTDLKYGDYTLHIQVLDKSSKKVYQDRSFRVVKKPMFTERIIVRIMGAVLLALITGFIVWRYLADTIIRRQYEQIRIAKDEADRANSAKSEFLADMSHEIRTPLNAVLGMNEMIFRESQKASDTEGSSGEDKEEAFNRIMVYSGNIQSAGSNLLSIINDILDFSKIEEGRMEIVEGNYSFGRLLNDISNMVSFKAREKKLDFITDVDEELPDSLYGDEVRVRQVITNILSNGVKYTNSGSVRLTVRGKKESGTDGEDIIRLSVRVEDTGIGIKEEDLDKLFTKFQRVDLAQNSTIEGTGLGLAIAKQLLTMMNGTISVDSTYGKGSVFSIELPQKIVSPEPIGDFRARIEESIIGSKNYTESFRAPDAHILIVDDTAMNLTVAVGLLSDTMINIDTAESGAEAVRLADSRSYDIILMDQRMPEMNGTEAMKRIRDNTSGPNAQTPIVCMTADALKGAKERYITEEFTDYLSKPISGRDLEQMLIKYLPEEKIVTVTEDRDGKALEMTVYEPLKRGGIDPKTGLGYCENKETLYYTLLGEYAAHYDERTGLFEKYRAEGNLADYAILAHSLKSTSRTIGAMEVSDLAAVLEKAADEGDTKTIDEKHDEMTAAYKKVVDAITDSPETSPWSGTDVTYDDDDEMIEFLPKSSR